MAAGATGITVAKVAEAEVMWAGGLRDIFIAYPVIGADKARRVAALIRQGCRLIVGVESEPGARFLSAGAVAAGVSIPVRVEVNTGLNRCGVAPDGVEQLASLVLTLPGLDLDGIFTFRSVSFEGSAGRAIADLGREEGTLMAELAARLRKAGIPVAAVSVGSTPTALHAAVPGVTEVRPGTYAFNDMMQVQQGTALLDMLAVTVLATVVSQPGPGLVTIDAGSKVFSGDVNPAGLGLRGYGAGFGRELFVERMNEEHGVVRVTGELPRIGEKLRFVPNHVCTSVNLSDELFGIRNGKVETVWAVAARGKRE